MIAVLLLAVAARLAVNRTRPVFPATMAATVTVIRTKGVTTHSATVKALTYTYCPMVPESIPTAA